MNVKTNIKTNNHMRHLVDGYEVTPKEREELDYVNWDGVDRGSDSFTGFRYRGWLYDLSEFEIAPDRLKVHGFDGWQTESAFSAVIVKYFDTEGNLLDNGDSVIVGYAHW